MEGPELSVVRVLDPALVEEVTALFDRAGRALGHAALSEPKRMALLHGGDGPGAGPHPLVAGLVARDAGHAVVGFAPVVGDPLSRQYTVEVVVEPTAGTAGTVGDALVDGAIDLVVRLGGGTLRLWSAPASPSDDARAEARGFRPERDLIQMRCSLPLADTDRGTDPAPAVGTRPFRPGRDETAWLTANNRAFASHPEQGHWDLATLLARQGEPWFDPEGLLLLEEQGRLVGSCWTKVHADTEPPMGEIYVIGVDPEFHGRGWGKALTRAGLDWLARRGLTVGMLYVDAANLTALSMYRSMGFVEDHVDRAYVGRFA